MGEGTLLAISRVAFLGARTKTALRKREARLAKLNQALRPGARKIAAAPVSPFDRTS